LALRHIQNEQIFFVVRSYDLTSDDLKIKDTNSELNQSGLKT